jgi:hypothetical protein
VRTLVVLLALVSSAELARAQPASSHSSDAPHLAATLAGIVTWQPADETYVSPNGPYLDTGLGGVGPGIAADLSYFSAVPVVVAFEFSTASISVDQKGRLVGGTAHSHLSDNIVAGLVGRDFAHHSLQVYGGLGWRIGQPTLNDVSVEDSDGSHVVLGGGIDGAAPVARRVDIVLTFRYWFTDRGESSRQIGVGNHVLRFGGGVRVRLGD